MAAFYLLGGTGCVYYCSGWISVIIDFYSCHNTGGRWLGQENILQRNMKIFFKYEMNKHITPK